MPPERPGKGNRYYDTRKAKSVVSPEAPLNEIPTKYGPGTKIADVPTSGNLAGQPLQGQMYLEVPPQNAPIPPSVLDAARKANVVIRDTQGRVYP